MWTKNTYLSGHQHTRDYSFRTCFASLSIFAITIYRLLLVIQSLRFYIIRLDLLFVKYFSGVAKVDNEICKPFVPKKLSLFCLQVVSSLALVIWIPTLLNMDLLDPLLLTASFAVKHFPIVNPGPTFLVVFAFRSVSHQTLHTMKLTT